jgi:hypothetical protein
MKNLIFVVTLILLMLLITSCEQVTEVTISDDNEDGIYHVEPEDEFLGNVELFMMPWTIQGSAINLLNGPVPKIAYDIFKRDDSSFKYFGDSYITSGGNSFQSGTQLPYDEWIRIRLVVYESGLAGWIVVFLQSLGLDFFESLEDYMIDEVYEADVYLSSEDGRRNVKISSWQKSTSKYKVTSNR